MPRPQRRAAPAEARKTERLEMRVQPAMRQAIRQAAALTGRTPADLAYETALRILEQHRRMALTEQDRAAFLDAILDPPQPNARLIEAARRYRARRA